MTALPPIASALLTLPLFAPAPEPFRRADAPEPGAQGPVGAVGPTAQSPAAPVLYLLSNDRLEVLPREPRAAFAKAAGLLEDRALRLAEAVVDAEVLRRLAEPPEGEPLVRWVRETVGRPVDVADFVLLIDDLVAASDLPETVNLPASRARAHGVLLHPAEVFEGRPRRYGAHGAVPLDDPPEQIGLEPAADGDPPGPRWTARYQQPMTDEGKLAELERENPPFGRAVRSLFEQLTSQGAFSWIEAGVRPRERGFLIYGSWLVSRATDEADLDARIEKLEGFERAWNLDIPIRWRHPGGPASTIEAARAMADTYGVDYATPRGARRSSHYGGRAVDLVAVRLPRRLVLEAPSGERRVFDLSGPDEARDLSLSPRLIRWIEARFGMRKLRKDYPHWSHAP